MNTPAWLEVNYGRFAIVDDQAHLTITVRVRRWHPGYWWARLRHAITGRTGL